VVAIAKIVARTTFMYCNGHHCHVPFDHLKVWKL